MSGLSNEFNFADIFPNKELQLMDRKLRILIVEDEAGIRMGLAYTLVPLRAEIIEAGDGAEALKILANQEVDLIITDLAMPQMNGLELLRRLRMSDKKYPTLVMTAHLDQIMAKQVMQLGALAIIDKPWSDEEMLQAVKNILDQTKGIAS